MPLAEDWFAENPAIFRKLEDDETIKPKDSNLKVAFCYEFKARNWQASYYAVGFEISYMNSDLEDMLRQEGLSWVACQTECRCKATIVQIVRPILGPADDKGVHKPFTAAAVGQLIAVHELQHFLRFCGIFDNIVIPKRLINDAEDMVKLYGRK